MDESKMIGILSNDSEQQFIGSLYKPNSLIGILSNDSEQQFIGSLHKPNSLIGILNISKGYDEYFGPYKIIPRVSGDQILETANRLVKENITVLEIPYYEVSNDSNGTTVFIAKEV